jgi:hypothetical protein
MLGRNQGIGATVPQQRPLPMPQMMPRQQMVAPGTPMMQTPSPRPMAMGGEVDIFGFKDGGPVPFGYDAAPEGQYYSPVDATFSARDILDFSVNSPGEYNPLYDLNQDGRITSGDALRAATRAQDAGISGSSAYDYGLSGQNYELRDVPEYNPETQYFYGDPSSGYEVLYRVPDYDVNAGEYLVGDERSGYEVRRTPPKGALTGASIGDGTFTAEDIMKAVSGLGTVYDEYDITGDGRVTSADALAYSDARGMSERYQSGELDGYDAFTNAYYYGGQGYGKAAYDNLLKRLAQEKDISEGTGIRFIGGVLYDGSQPYSGEYEGNIYTDGSKTGEVDRQAITGLSIGDGTFTAEDIMKAAVGLGTIYDEYDFNKDGRITSDDALVYQKSLEGVEDQVVDGGETSEFSGPATIDRSITGASLGDATFTAEDILKASTGLGAKYDEYDFNKDGIISSDDALQYQRYLDSLVSTEEGGETVVTGGGETVVDGGGTTFTGLPVTPKYDPTTQRLIYDPATNTFSVEDIMVSAPVTQITGSESGPGSAVTAGGNFGVGSYTASPVAPAEVNPIDYTQFTGDVGRFSGTPETSVLFGPRMNIPTSVSQYQTDFSRPNLVTSGSPSVGGLTTTYGPEMVATSPIGAIKLPARPVEIDIFDFLSTPTYGTMYSGIDPINISESNNLLDTSAYSDINPIGLRNGGSVPVPFMGGGSVPRQAEIAGQPHMLAYINQDEEALLRSFGGSGISGPGGIPSYPPIGPSGYVSLDAMADAAVKSDPNTSFSHMGKTYDNVFDYHDAVFGGDDDSSGSVNTSSKDADLSVGGSDKTVTADQLLSGDGTTTYNTDDGGSVTVATGSTIDDILSATSSDDGGSSVIDVIAPESVYTPPAPVYTDRRGNKFSTQAEADASDRAFAAQLALYGSGKVGFDRFAGQARDSGIFDTSEEANRAAASAYPTFLENFNEGREINIFDPAPFTYTDIGGIGSGDITGGGGGITPVPIMSPRLPSRVGDESGFLASDLDKALLDASRPVIGLDAPVQVDPDADDPRGNQIVSPTGTGIGLQSDLQRGLGAPPTVQDVAPPEDGYTSLQNLKDRIVRAEGTADEGGYGRLLGNQEGRFGVDLTNMTVQEVLDFQKQRGPGSYAEYSQGVNKQRGKLRADGSGVISTPAGKYQVVGDTLEGLIKAGVVDPNEKFNEATQERIGTHLIMNDLADGKGLSDLKSGDITQEQFEAALGKQFEGIDLGLDKGAGSTPLVIGAASETGKKVVQDERDANVEKIQQQISGDAEPTGVEKFFYDIVGQLGFGLGKGLADDLRNASKENRQAIINQHVYALQNGATPKTDKDGNYVGFDISTMDTFGDKVLAAEDITQFLPGGAKDADGDGVPDSVRLGQVFDAQSVAAGADPYGTSTEQGFITSDGKEFFVDASGKVVEVTDGNVPYEVGGGQSVAEALGLTETTTGDGESGAGKNYTMGPDGTIVCNDAGYVYNSETDMCEPPAESAEVEQVLSARIAEPARTFDEILSGVVKPGPTIAPISANIGKMQGGGMAGLNRAADNFLKALAG